MATITKMKAFCEKHKIFYPDDSVKSLTAAIFRATAHMNAITSKTCFGLWENENSTCVTCDYEGKCFETAMGTTKEKYFKKFSKADAVGIRTTQRFYEKDIEL